MRQERNLSTSDRPNLSGARDMLLELLTQMGCQYDFDEENRIRFIYQGSVFMADAANDCPFVVIWYTFWYENELSDIDTLSKARLIINDVNIQTNIKVFYSINEEDNKFHIHGKKQFLFIPEIPDKQDYLESIFIKMFGARHHVESELAKR